MDMNALVRFAGVGMETASEGRMRNSSRNLPRLVQGSQAKPLDDRWQPKAVLQERTSNTHGTHQRNTTPDSHKRSRPLSSECNRNDKPVLFKYNNTDHVDDDNQSSNSSDSSNSESSYESDFELDDNVEMESVSNLRYCPEASSTVESKQSTPRNRRSLRHSRFAAKGGQLAPTLSLLSCDDDAGSESNVVTSSSSCCNTNNSPSSPPHQHWKHEALIRPSTDGNFSSSGSLVYSDFVVRSSGLVPNLRSSPLLRIAPRPQTCGHENSRSFSGGSHSSGQADSTNSKRKSTVVGHRVESHSGVRPSRNNQDHDTLGHSPRWSDYDDTSADQEREQTNSSSSNLCSQDDLVSLGYLGQGASGIVSKALHVTALVVVAVKAVPVHDTKKRDQSIAEIRSLYSSIVPFPHQVTNEKHSNGHNHSRGRRNDNHASGIMSEETKYGESKEEELEGKCEQSASKHCPYIVSLYDAFINRDDSTINLVLEWMDGGSLQDVIDAHDGPLPESAIANIAACVLRGLVAVHARRQIHRDLKPSNILLNSNGVAKLSDFGVAHSFGTQSNANTFVGSVSYMAPERIASGGSGGREDVGVISTKSRSSAVDGYSYASDIWSAGLCIMVCATGGKYPFATAYSEGGYWGLVQAINSQRAPRLRPHSKTHSALQPHHQSQNSERTQHESDYDSMKTHSPELCNFVAQCLRHDAALRPSAQELLRHPFLIRHNVTRRCPSDGTCTDSERAATTQAAVRNRNISLSGKLPTITKTRIVGSRKREDARQLELDRVIRLVVEHHRSASLKLQHTLPRFSQHKVQRLTHQLGVELSETEVKEMCNRMQVDCRGLKMKQKTPMRSSMSWARRTTDLELGPKKGH